LQRAQRQHASIIFCKRRLDPLELLREGLEGMHRPKLQFAHDRLELA
jgi:hypothetical protein